MGGLSGLEGRAQVPGLPQSVDLQQLRRRIAKCIEVHPGPCEELKNRGSKPSLPGAPQSAGGARPPQPSPPPPPLPPLSDVKPSVGKAASWSPPRRSTRPGSGGGGGYGSFRSPAQTARDRDLGRRGEQLVVDHLRAMGEQFGFRKDAVVWTSEHKETFNHDIRVENHAGEEICIEVKSTSGTDGSFK